VLSRIIERGLVKDGRLVRLRVHLLTTRSAQSLTSILAQHRANIVETDYDALPRRGLGETAIEITMETAGPTILRKSPLWRGGIYAGKSAVARGGGHFCPPASSR